MPYRYWTEAEEAHLQQDYADTPTHVLATRFNCSVRSVYYKANKMGLKKSAAYLAKPLSGRIQSGSKIGGDTRFKPGFTPWNKGKKGYDVGGRSAETRFKKGHRPQTWVPVGSRRITKDGYRQRKVSDTGYMPRDWKGEHILLWEECHGPAPKGHAVVFRDGNKQNIQYENLELISRAELMRRNTIHRYPEALKKTIRVAGKLHKSIREKNHEKQN